MWSQRAREYAQDRELADYGRRLAARVRVWSDEKLRLELERPKPSETELTGMDRVWIETIGWEAERRWPKAS